METAFPKKLILPFQFTLYQLLFKVGLFPFFVFFTVCVASQISRFFRTIKTGIRQPSTPPFDSQSSCSRCKIAHPALRNTFPLRKWAVHNRSKRILGLDFSGIRNNFHIRYSRLHRTSTHLAPFYCRNPIFPNRKIKHCISFFL